MTEHIEESIRVRVPVHEAYEQWTNFEEFPRFMSGIEEVRRTGEGRLHWVGTIAGKDKEWDAEVVAEEPEEKVAWRSTSGSPNHGTVKFREVDQNETEVNLTMEVEPEDTLEDIASWLGLVENRVEGDLENFKEYIEGREGEAGEGGTIGTGGTGTGEGGTGHPGAGPGSRTR
jgi:uncharacterized membrane protein